jgi:hypothetical protein
LGSEFLQCDPQCAILQASIRGPNRASSKSHPQTVRLGELGRNPDLVAVFSGKRGLQDPEVLLSLDGTNALGLGGLERQSDRVRLDKPRPIRKIRFVEDFIKIDTRHKARLRVAIVRVLGKLIYSRVFGSVEFRRKDAASRSKKF